MKRALLLFVFLVSVPAFISQPAHAQFWKEIFKKESKKPVRRPPVRPAAPAKSGPAPLKGNAVPPKKKAPVPKEVEEVRELEESVFKDRYRIDVLAPLYLHELVKGGKAVYKSHLPDKVLPGLNFYQGIKLAADTLDSYGYHLDVHVHDIADPANTVEGLIARGRLDSTDLIIGAVQSRQIQPLAAFAKKHTVNFISALSPSDGNVKDNLYFSLLQPTLERHCEVLRSAIARKGRKANILMYHRSIVPVDEKCFEAMTRGDEFSYTKVQMNTMMPAEKLRNFLDSNAENVIVMPIVDVAYAKQLLDQLAKSFPKFHFEVYGMPSWKGLSLLRKEGSLPNVGITISAPFYFDPTASAGRGFAEAFTRAFGGKPTELAYRGYETLYWYAYLLKRYGTVFNEHYRDNGAAPFTRFDLRPAVSDDEYTDYFENSHVYLYRYQSGSFSVEQ